MDHAIACSRILSAKISRRSGGSSFESRKPRTRYLGSRITAAATTGPKREPRPTSSTPATKTAPFDHALFSYFKVQCRRLRSRSFAADAESCFSRARLAVAGMLEKKCQYSAKLSSPTCALWSKLENYGYLNYKPIRMPEPFRHP